MGWLIVLLLAAAAFAAIWRYGRLDRGGLQLTAAALLLALAGYAWQGRPMLEGTSSRAIAPRPLPETGFMQLRRDLVGQFDTADRWLTISESIHRRGNSADAAGAIRSAIREHPDNFVLWIGYGYALAVHAGGLTPASQLAFKRAATIAPDHPAPSFFYARLLAETGDLDEAERIWRGMLQGDPESDKWRAALEAQLALVVQARAIAGAPPAPPVQPQPQPQE
ncbi:MAG: tetratricopeptide repeat protein [Allosphingosinicella sp.]